MRNPEVSIPTEKTVITVRPHRLPMSFYLAAFGRKDCQLAIKTEGARIKLKALSQTIQ